MPSARAVFFSRKVSDTKSIGRRLGRGLRPGQKIFLYGELGSGKTVLVKGIASALKIPEKEITSASFVLVAEHEGEIKGVGKVPFYHVDLYRLEGMREIENIGLEDYIDSGGIAVIEWADRLPQTEEGIRVNIKVVSGGKREIIIEGVNEKDRDSHQRGPAKRDRNT